VVLGAVDESSGGTDMLGGASACALPAVGVIGVGGTGAEELDQGPLKAFSDSWVVCPSLWIAEAQTADSTKPAGTQDAIFNLIRVSVLVLKLLSECECVRVCLAK
jgi:hypothetical protein